MIRHRDIEQLQQLSQAPGKTLTVYLDVDQTNAANRKRQFETRLKDMLSSSRPRNPDDDELPRACSRGRGDRQAHRAGRQDARPGPSSQPRGDVPQGA